MARVVLKRGDERVTCNPKHADAYRKAGYKTDDEKGEAKPARTVRKKKAKAKKR